MLELSSEQAAAIIAHATDELPNECCGLLTGRNGLVERVVRGTNVDHSPYTYRMDPREQLVAFKTMEADRQELVAIYHSHPQSPAYPSKTDVARAYYPDTLYLIVSLQDRASPSLRAFRIANGQISEERVIVR